MSSNDTAKNTAPAAGAPNDGQDLTVFVQSLLEQMQSRFTQMSEAIIGRIDEMGARIDDLEKSIADLMDQTNEDGAEKTPEVPNKGNGESV